MVNLRLGGAGCCNWVVLASGDRLVARLVVISVECCTGADECAVSV